MSNWEMKPLTEVAYTAGRIGWKGLTRKEYTKEGPFFLSVHGLNYGDYVDFRDAFHISQERYDESPEIMLRADDVLLCKDGAGIGKAGIVRDLPGPSSINSSLLLIRAGERLVPKFLYFNLLGPFFQRIVQSQIDGATTPHLYQKDIKTFPIPIPEVAEQKRIVSILDEAFSAIAKAKENAEKNLLGARELFESYLNRVFTQQGPGWQERSIGDETLLTINDGDRGKNYPKKKDFLDEGYCLFMNTKNVRPDGLNFDTTMFITKERDELLRKGKLVRNDVVLTTRGTIGNLGIYTNEVPFENVRINSGMLILRPNLEVISPEYLFDVMRSRIVTRQIDERVTGAAQPQLPIKTLVHFRIPVPACLKIQSEIVKSISRVSAESERLETIYTQKLANLDELKQSLLQKAFTGQLTREEVAV